MTGRVVRSIAVLALAALVAAGCAASRAFRAGGTAERGHDYDRAVLEYTRAIRLDPDNRSIALALQRAKLRAAETHFASGRRQAALGRYEDALVEYQLASDMNPTSGAIAEALAETRNTLRAKLAVRREGKTELETLIDRTRALGAPGLELTAAEKLPDSLIFRNASSRDVFTSLAQFAGLSVVFDPAFREAPISVDLRGSVFAEALASVAASTRNFYRVTGERSITIIPDTPAKRREYEEEVVRTFYLSNADLKETIDLLRIVIDSRRIAPITATNAISIKDTPERIEAAARLIGAIDKARAEVVIDVELLEVDRTRLQEYGLQIASPLDPGVAGGVSVPEELSLRDLRQITQADVLVTNLPALFYRLLKTDASTRTLANPHLRTSEGLTAQARFGERVPVPSTTFSPIATGGLAQQPITSFVYENIGVNIDITPRTHHNDDVSLSLKIEVSSLSGVGFGGLPTFGNRAITTTIRLRDGETNLLAGLIRDDERDQLTGLPGLSDLPVVGRLFARNRRERQETDIILTLTPHIIRVLDLSEADLRPFRVGRTGDAALDVPVPQEGAPPIKLPPPEVKPPPPPPRPPGAWCPGTVIRSITPGRGSPPGRVARRLHIPNMRTPRALPGGRRAPGLLPRITVPGH